MDMKETVHLSNGVEALTIDTIVAVPTVNVPPQ